MRQKAIILYIEDNPNNAALIERILNSFGYEVLVAATGLKGLNMAIESKPDLILVDINLPDMSGFEVAMRLRELGDFYRTPIIALTAQYDDEYRHMARLSGIDSFLGKPVNIDELGEQIEAYLDEKTDNLSVTLSADNLRRDPQLVDHVINKLRELEETNHELRTNNRELVEQLVTRLRAMEASNAELRRLDSLKDNFIQRTAHELRTPLTVIVGYTRLLKGSAAYAEAIKSDSITNQYMDSLVESIERLRRVVDEIVLTSRLASGKLDMVPVSCAPLQIIQQALAPFLPSAKERRLEVELNTEHWPPALVVDPGLFRLALSNLISNAIKYTPDGGHIWVSARQQGEWIRISIKDSGVGIAPDEQKRIFERFHSPDNVRLHSSSKTAFRGGGLGLGLATCKAIIEAHGGKISVESPGADAQQFPGSTFHIDLPAAGAPIDKSKIYQSW